MANSGNMIWPGGTKFEVGDLNGRKETQHIVGEKSLRI
jgi:hypothetical protein